MLCGHMALLVDGMRRGSGIAYSVCTILAGKGMRSEEGVNLIFPGGREERSWGFL